MKKYLSLIAFFALLIWLPKISISQNNSKTVEKYQIETLDGNEYFGIILNQTTDTLKFKADRLGEISIPRSKIKKN